MKSKINKSRGFTIIEVMIVLAIAGLIMLVVFLAVPALQRNARNAEYRAESARILGAVAEFAANNNGVQPIASDSNTAGSNAKVILDASNTKNITRLVIEPETGTGAASGTQVIIRLVAKCNAAFNETDPGAGRQVALLSQIEIATSPGVATNCIQS